MSTRPTSLSHDRMRAAVGALGISPDVLDDISLFEAVDRLHISRGPAIAIADAIAAAVRPFDTGTADVWAERSEKLTDDDLEQAIEEQQRAGDDAPDLPGTRRQYRGKPRTELDFENHPVHFERGDRIIRVNLGWVDFDGDFMREQAEVSLTVAFHTRNRQWMHYGVVGNRREELEPVHWGSYVYADMATFDPYNPIARGFGGYPYKAFGGYPPQLVLVCDAFGFMDSADGWDQMLEWSDHDRTVDNSEFLDLVLAYPRSPETWKRHARDRGAEELGAAQGPGSGS